MELRAAASHISRRVGACGLPLERLRELLGLARIEDVLPYAQLAVTGTLERDVDRFYLPFIRLVQEVPVAA